VFLAKYPAVISQKSASAEIYACSVFANNVLVGRRFIDLHYQGSRLTGKDRGGIKNLTGNLYNHLKI
jgi:hypothetical protein